MTKKIFRKVSLACLFVLLTSTGHLLGAPGQQLQNLPDPPYAIVTYSDGSSVVTTGNGSFMRVGLQPDEVVQVIVQYPSNDILQLIDLEAIDGGLLAPPAASALPAPPIPGASPCPDCRARS